MSKPARTETHLQVGEQSVALRRKGQSVVVANILGDRTLDGHRHLVLDRRIHRVGEDRLGEWICWGAVVTELRAP